VAARQVTTSRERKRTRALAMVRSLYSEGERMRRGRSMIAWCPLEMVVKRRTDVNVLAFAAARGWIEVSLDARSVRVTEAGRRQIGRS
jgi:hypothetical protein